METIFKKNNIKEILLNVSIDPIEQKNDVMRRLNFYIGLQYKVYDIKFRKKFTFKLYYALGSNICK